MLFVFMNIAVACMVLSIIALRKVFLHIIPSVILGISWGLVFFRLFVPFDITTNYNFYNAFYYFIENVLHMSLSNSIFSNLVTIIVDASQKSNGFCLDYLSYGYAVSCMWEKIFRCRFSKKAIRLKTDFHSYGKTKRRSMKSYPLTVCQRNIFYMRTKPSPPPFAYGILKPMILFPKGFYKAHADMFDEALLHEYMHLKYHHQIIQYFLILVVMIGSVSYGTTSGGYYYGY